MRHSSWPRIQFTMSTPSAWSKPQITTSASTPSAALPRSSAVVIPASDRSPRLMNRTKSSSMVIAASVGDAFECCALVSSMPEHDGGKRRGDEQQHDGREDPDRRDEHRSAAPHRVLVQLLAARVANVFAQGQQTAPEVDAP